MSFGKRKLAFKGDIPGDTDPDQASEFSASVAADITLTTACDGDEEPKTKKRCESPESRVSTEGVDDSPSRSPWQSNNDRNPSVDGDGSDHHDNSDSPESCDRHEYHPNCSRHASTDRSDSSLTSDRHASKDENDNPARSDRCALNNQYETPSHPDRHEMGVEKISPLFSSTSQARSDQTGMQAMTEKTFSEDMTTSMNKGKVSSAAVCMHAGNDTTGPPKGNHTEHPVLISMVVRADKKVSKEPTHLLAEKGTTMHTNMAEIDEIIHIDITGMETVVDTTVPEELTGMNTGNSKTIHPDVTALQANMDSTVPSDLTCMKTVNDTTDHPDTTIHAGVGKIVAEDLPDFQASNDTADLASKQTGYDRKVDSNFITMQENVDTTIRQDLAGIQRSDWHITAHPDQTSMHAEIDTTVPLYLNGMQARNDTTINPDLTIVETKSDTTAPDALTNLQLVNDTDQTGVQLEIDKVIHIDLTQLNISTTVLPNLTCMQTGIDKKRHPGPTSMHEKVDPTFSKELAGKETGISSTYTSHPDQTWIHEEINTTVPPDLTSTQTGHATAVNPDPTISEELRDLQEGIDATLHPNMTDMPSQIEQTVPEELTDLQEGNDIALFLNPTGMASQTGMASKVNTASPEKLTDLQDAKGTAPHPYTTGMPPKVNTTVPGEKSVMDIDAVPPDLTCTQKGNDAIVKPDPTMHEKVETTIYEELPHLQADNDTAIHPDAAKIQAELDNMVLTDLTYMPTGNNMIHPDKPMQEKIATTVHEELTNLPARNETIMNHGQASVHIEKVTAISSNMYYIQAGNDTTINQDPSSTQEKEVTAVSEELTDLHEENNTLHPYQKGMQSVIGYTVPQSRTFIHTQSATAVHSCPTQPEKTVDMTITEEMRKLQADGPEVYPDPTGVQAEIGKTVLTDMTSMQADVDATVPSRLNYAQAGKDATIYPDQPMQEQVNTTVSRVLTNLEAGNKTIMHHDQTGVQAEMGITVCPDISCMQVGQDAVIYQDPTSLQEKVVSVVSEKLSGRKTGDTTIHPYFASKQTEIETAVLSYQTSVEADIGTTIQGDPNSLQEKFDMTVSEKLADQQEESDTAIHPNPTGMPSTVSTTVPEGLPGIDTGNHSTSHQDQTRMQTEINAVPQYLSCTQTEHDTTVKSDPAMHEMVDTVVTEEPTDLQEGKDTTFKHRDATDLSAEVKREVIEELTNLQKGNGTALHPDATDLQAESNKTTHIDLMTMRPKIGMRVPPDLTRLQAGNDMKMHQDLTSVQKNVDITVFEELGGMQACVTTTQPDQNDMQAKIDTTVLPDSTNVQAGLDTTVHRGQTMLQENMDTVVFEEVSGFQTSSNGTPVHPELTGMQATVSQDKTGVQEKVNTTVPEELTDTQAGNETTIRPHQTDVQVDINKSIHADPNFMRSKVDTGSPDLTCKSENTGIKAIFQKCGEQESKDQHKNHAGPEWHSSKGRHDKSSEHERRSSKDRHDKSSQHERHSSKGRQEKSSKHERHSSKVRHDNSSNSEHHSGKGRHDKSTRSERHSSKDRHEKSSKSERHPSQGRHHISSRSDRHASKGRYNKASTSDGHSSKNTHHRSIKSKRHESRDGNCYSRSDRRSSKGRQQNPARSDGNVSKGLHDNSPGFHQHANRTGHDKSSSISKHKNDTRRNSPRRLIGQHSIDEGRGGRGKMDETPDRTLPATDLRHYITMRKRQSDGSDSDVCRNAHGNKRRRSKDGRDDELNRSLDGSKRMRLSCDRNDDRGSSDRNRNRSCSNGDENERGHQNDDNRKVRLRERDTFQNNGTGDRRRNDGDILDMGTEHAENIVPSSHHYRHQNDKHDPKQYGNMHGQTPSGYHNVQQDPTTSHFVSMQTLYPLETKKPRDIIMTLAQSETVLDRVLTDSVDHQDVFTLFLSVFAKAVSCKSMKQHLTHILSLLNEQQFFNIASTYFMKMPPEEAGIFGKALKDMLKIMEKTSSITPMSVVPVIAIHGILEAVIDRLRDKSVIVDGDMLSTFKAFTVHKNKLLSKNIRKVPFQEEIQREQLEEKPSDFREIDIFPHISDMQVQSGQDLRPNKVIGKYDNLEQYLDIQYRLLREDFVAPLREGINEYIQSLEDNEKHRTFQDVKIYHNVTVIAPVCNEVGICYLLKFDVSYLGKVRWESSKRLIYGSLLCLSQDNFQTFCFATVIDRKTEHLLQGLLTVRFEHSCPDVHVLFHSVFTMAETTAYFESYRHVLTGLQNFEVGDQPFEKYIICCENKVEPPAYLRRKPDTTFDLRPLVDEGEVLQRGFYNQNRRAQFTRKSTPAKNVEILDLESWPSADLLHMDASQMQAVQTALTKEFAIIQGPPGTGKTYIGLKIAKALLHNKRAWESSPNAVWNDLRPMLIVCYTNHALDQFLEGIVKFYQKGVLRVGGKSKSEVLENLNLKEARRRVRAEKTLPFELYLNRKETKEEMDSLHSSICENSAVIKFAKTAVLHERFLSYCMRQHHILLQMQVRVLMGSYPNAARRTDFSAILVWLGLSHLCATNVRNTSQTNYSLCPDNSFIDIEEEVDFIQIQRHLNDLDEINAAFKNKTQYTRNEKENQTTYIELRVKQKAVALDIEAAEVRASSMDRLKRDKIGLVQYHLQCSDVMSDVEANQIVDMFNMSSEDKWRLYRLWRERCIEIALKRVSADTDRYEAAVRRYREMCMQVDREIMQSSTIIGMTTTGAARYQAILQEVQPRIIIVEEAAEVLEAHIVTALSKTCEHLILIGDHKQLRPNPTVYKLANEFNLDVSLFERMVKNQFQCDCLELQHRMRPEIADLMHHIYKNYRNHDDVKKYDSIKGVSTNVFFINHNAKESRDGDSKSHSNAHEADFVVALCRYLLQQGYKRKQITVLTLYSGQQFALRQRMPKSEFDGVRVTVVDNYQGEENDIILLTLVRSNSAGKIGFLKTNNRVCVALSRAKMGLYVVGNFDLLSECSKTYLWRSLVQDLQQKNIIGNGLVLKCQNHPNDDGTVVKCMEDFEKVPEGGCYRKCDHRLSCGHVCEMYCHVLDEGHRDYKCMKICGKIICAIGHHCEKRCNETCGKCTVLVDKTIPKCGHLQKVPCHERPEDFACKWECKTILACGHPCKSPCGMVHTTDCVEIVEKTWPCGHKRRLKCYQKDDTACSNPCDTLLECGHQCPGTCDLCVDDRLHFPCNQDCNRILVCGHECTGLCNHCRPCTRKCENRCIHSKCMKPCGELCNPCKEPCPWQCEHFKCTKLCSESCDRPRCNKPCKRTIKKCKHPCIGLCGEPCPTDCRKCDAEKVKEILFGDEDEPDSLFVLLEDCSAKCIIESKAMDRYMDSAQDAGEEIMLKKCPKCNTAIRKNKRYGTIINKTLQDIEHVKSKVLTNKITAKKMEMDLHTSIKITPFDQAVKNDLNRRLRKMAEPKTENALTALKNQMEIVRRLKKFEIKLKKQTNHGENQTLLAFIARFQTWAMAERQVMPSNETEAAERELLRLRHHIKFQLHHKRLKELKRETEEKLKLQILQVSQILGGRGKYSEPERGIVEECLSELEKVAPLGGLGIDEEERVMIVKAMDLRSGHWFKCPQGHVYAIGDCGGAMIEAKCPECDACIGGAHHTLRADNQLASEMDNAQYPAWSEQANMANYGFNAQF